MQSNRKNILVLHNVTNDFGVPQNYTEFLRAFRTYADDNIYYINPTIECINLDQINQFDVIIIFHSLVIYSEEALPYFWRILLREAKCYKILMNQENFIKVDYVLSLINYIKINLILTCVPESSITQIYNPEKLPDVKVISILTAYVPDCFKDLQFVPLENRKYDVVYRGRKGSAWYGDLVREKWQIGERFKKDSNSLGLTVNISSSEEDRLYGDEWFSFLSSSKSVLGTEGGSGVVDFSGEVESKTIAHERLFPNASYEQLKDLYFKELDGKIVLNVLSPRIFEYAATRTLMILYEGEYSGILLPWVHYIPLRKDHSNYNEILHYLNDNELCMKIINKAHEDLIISDKYSYKAFMKYFYTLLEELPCNNKFNLTIHLCQKIDNQSFSVDRHQTSNIILLKNAVKPYVPPVIKSAFCRFRDLLKAVNVAKIMSVKLRLVINSRLVDEVNLISEVLNMLDYVYKTTGIEFVEQINKNLAIANILDKSEIKLDNEFGLPHKFQNYKVSFSEAMFLRRIFLSK